jgi:hypothetical protein
MEWNDAGNTKQKNIAENQSRKQKTGGRPLLIVGHSVVVQDIMEIAGRHYLEGDDIDQGGEVCILY